MKKLILVTLVVGFFLNCGAQKISAEKDAEGWYNLFNGVNLDNWKFSEKEGTFSVKDGMIKVNGDRSHLFYDGTVENHDFKNFELQVDVMTKPNSNSGVYFHTEYQKDGWPDKGYEVQVNNSHGDWRRTSGLYAVMDMKNVPTKDNEWFTMYISVKGKHIVTKLNGVISVDYIEPENVIYEGMPGRKISRGTICLQGHDPESTVYFKNIKIKPLP
ncbi:MAG: DUF1080 domain-containing protein [Bacteroidetes bacterium]|nr:DUF1080 domain-containing protein [Bacteroidota bacterium]